MTKAHVSHNSGNNEWYTPREYIEAARLVMGGIDLDPASSASANEVIQATRYLTQGEDGLAYRWAGRVWMNPPYSQLLIRQFCAKFARHVRNGDIEQAIVLVNNATETGWFQELASVAQAIMFPRGRLPWWSPNGRVTHPLQGQAFLYFGPNVAAFIAHFGKWGFVAAATAGALKGDLTTGRLCARM